MSDESSAQLSEDLAIMSRLLQKAADPGSSRGQGPWALGIPVLGLGGQRANQNIYLEGYGMLFLHSVPFPLQPEDPTGTNTDTTSKQKDSPWDQAKREVLTGKNTDPGNKFSIAWETRFESAEFDAAKLEALKEAMTEALKQSANIRVLKPEERVTVVFSGPVARTGKKGKKTQTPRKATPPKPPDPQNQQDTPPAHPNSCSGCARPMPRPPSRASWTIKASKPASRSGSRRSSPPLPRPRDIAPRDVPFFF